MSDHCWRGKILVVDLSGGTCTPRSIPDEVYEAVLSGLGLGVWYLNRAIPPGADPLGPDNVLGITSGLLTGAGPVMTGRWMAVCKSPLTGGWGDSNCGGDFAPAIKHCGFDAIFFHGISPKPVYLLVEPSGAKLMDAAAYWGADALETERRLVEAHRKNRKPAVAAIGPAGEKLSLIAGISNDSGRFAARSGVGAVMGSKRLKAIVLSGARPVPCADPGGVKSLNVEYSGKVRRAEFPRFVKGAFLPLMGKAMGALPSSIPLDGMLTTMLMRTWGSCSNNTLGLQNGDVPVKNWSGSVRDFPPPKYRAINPDRITERQKYRYHCYSCIIGCGGICDISDIEGREGALAHKPEYETVISFSALHLNSDLDSVFRINELLNRAGMDTISAGMTAAFAIECFENGILTLEDTGGLELRWGDARAVIVLLEKMIAREGIGDILADGVKKAAERIGKGSGKFAVHAGGQELPMHDPRIDPMLGVVYSADPTPGRHTTSSGLYYSTSALWDKVSWLEPFAIHPKKEDHEPSRTEASHNVAMTCFKMLVDGSGGCYYAMMGGIRHFRLFDYLNCATGWDKTADDYMEIGKRIQTLRQLFNIRHGVKPRSFRMHDRAAGSPPLASGHNKGITLKIDEMIPLYNEAWGWDGASGAPLAETLEKLSIPALLALQPAGNGAPDA